MRIQIVSRMIMLSMLAVLASAVVHAQSGKQLNVNVPFDFSVQGTTFPAGHYLIGQGTQTSEDFLTLRRTDGPETAVFLTSGIHDRRIQQESRLVFRRYGSQYFLSAVWNSGSSSGRGLTPTRRERQLAKENEKQGKMAEEASIRATRQ
jgi:hypothetical protein